MSETELAEQRSPGFQRVEMGPLVGALGFLLRLSQLSSREDFLTNLAHLNIRPSILVVLVILRHNPGIRQGQLAEHLFIKRANMTKMIRALEDDGLVERTIPDNDRRSVELRLTGKGEALVERDIGPFMDYEAQPKPRLTSEEEATLIVLLRKYIGIPAEGGGQ